MIRSRGDPPAQRALDPLHAQHTVGATGFHVVGCGDLLLIAELDNRRRHHPVLDRPHQPLMLRVAAAVRPALGGRGTAATAGFAGIPLAGQLPDPPHDHPG